ncbi:MAG: protein kinase [Acidobacteriota bacterium]
MNSKPEIPGYQIEKEIAQGGMSRIYAAIDRIRDRKVALKIFSPSMANEKDARERFISEGDILSKLNHKNIVPVYDVGSYGELNYIAVEYLEGKSLKERILPGETDNINVEESLDVIREIAGALEYSHNKGLIHRDIKPENILFRNNGTPVLVDFGIAKDYSESKNFTMTGTSIGTPYYMSPEQIKGYPPDSRNDIYSLGVVLYEMLTGDIPYKGTDIITVAMKHERDPIPSLPSETAYLQPLVNRMMAKKSKNRPEGGKKVIELIESLTIESGSGFPEWKLVQPQKKVKKFFLKMVFFILIFLIPYIAGHMIKKMDDVKLDEKKIILKKENKSLNIKKPSVSKRRIRPDIRLRSNSRNINEKDLTGILKRNNLYDSEYNPSGNFINRYRTEISKQQKVVIDGKTGLMWHHRGSFKAMSIKTAREWIKELNRKRFAGFNNWRLPTIEEGASLLEKKEWYGGLHIFSVFSVVQKEIWTSDINADKNTNWIVSFRKGRIRNVSLFRKKFFVRPVRKFY